MLIYLNNITDFLHPNRLIWQETDPAGGNVDADTDADTDFSNPDTDTDKNAEFMGADRLEDDIARSLKAIEFQKKIKEEYDKTAQEGRSAMECSLGQIEELRDVARLGSFIDELFEKFLVEGEGYKNIKDTFQRLQILKNECDMERIVKCFNKSESYRINTYTDSQIDKNPSLSDHIIFTYKNGNTEIINLELSQDEKADVFLPVAKEFVRKKAIADAQAKMSDQQKAEEGWRKSHPMYDPWKEWRAKYEDSGRNKSNNKEGEEKQQTSEWLYGDEYYDDFLDDYITENIYK